MDNTEKLNRQIKKQKITAMIMFPLGVILSVIGGFLFKVNVIAFYLLLCFGIAFLISGTTLWLLAKYYRKNKEKGIVDERISAINEKTNALIGRILLVVLSIEFLIVVLYCGVCVFADKDIDFKLIAIVYIALAYLKTIVFNFMHIFIHKYYTKKF